jgi:ribosomal protein S18
MKKIFLSFALLSSSIFAQEVLDPELIYAKKCAMCHIVDASDSNGPKVAPPLNTAMKNVMIGIDVIEEPENDEKWVARTKEYLIDYFKKPLRSKSYCEDISFEKFGTMPSMIGWMTDKQIEIISNYITENNRITKDEKEDYVNQNGIPIK